MQKHYDCDYDYDFDRKNKVHAPSLSSLWKNPREVCKKSMNFTVSSDDQEYLRFVACGFHGN